MDEKGGYDRVKGDMNGKMKHKGVEADEQTKLHEVKVEIMQCRQFSASVHINICQLGLRGMPGYDP